VISLDGNRIEVAQKILDWAIMDLKESIKCKVDSYKDEKYPVRFFTKENKLIKAINIPEEWIEDTNPSKNEIHDKLKSLLRNIEKEAKRKGS
jgi:hypothetical protein